MSFTKHVRTFIFTLTDLQQLDSRISGLPRSNNPIVSFTSVPQRLNQVKATVISLLKQSLPPKEIHINLGENLFLDKKIPDFLMNLKTVKVFWVKKDFGPATKYIPTLERFSDSDQLLVICDDDMYYAANLLETLVNADAKSAGKNSYCINGLKVPSNFQSKSRPSDKAIRTSEKQVAIIEGCGGYTLRSSFVDFNQLKNTEGAPARCLFDDDVWLSGHLSRNNIKKFQIPAGKRKSLMNTIESAISGDREKLQTELMTHFKNDWAKEEIQPV